MSIGSDLRQTAEIVEISVDGAAQVGSGRAAPGSPDIVRCTVTGVPSVVVDLGDGGDGDGDDDDAIDSTRFGQAAVSTILEGGPGNDDPSVGIGPDIARDAAGDRDTVSYMAVTQGPTTITLNGVADDGLAGEGDDTAALTGAPTMRPGRAVLLRVTTRLAGAEPARSLVVADGRRDWPSDAPASRSPRSGASSARGIELAERQPELGEEGAGERDRTRRAQVLRGVQCMQRDVAGGAVLAEPAMALRRIDERVPLRRRGRWRGEACGRRRRVAAGAPAGRRSSSHRARWP